MAAVTAVFVKEFVLGGGGAPGSVLRGELFSVPAATAADTTTLQCTRITNPLAVVGNVTTAALTPSTSGPASIAVTSILDTIAASKFIFVLVIGS